MTITITELCRAMNDLGIPMIEPEKDDVEETPETPEVSDLAYHGQFERFTA